MYFMHLADGRHSRMDPRQRASRVLMEKRLAALRLSTIEAPAEEEMLLALFDGCADVVNRLSSSDGGFELLRMLALKFDAAMPNLYRMLMASMYGLANDKCTDCKATVMRVAHIERISTDVAERAGKRPDEQTIANIFYEPSSFIIALF